MDDRRKEGALSLSIFPCLTLVIEAPRGSDTVLTTQLMTYGLNHSHISYSLHIIPVPPESNRSETDRYGEETSIDHCNHILSRSIPLGSRRAPPVGYGSET